MIALFLEKNIEDGFKPSPTFFSTSKFYYPKFLNS